MTPTMRAGLRRAVEGIDGERFTPSVTMLALGILGTLGTPDLFRTPVVTLIVIVIGVAGVRLVLRFVGHTGPRPSALRLLRAVLAALRTAVSQVVGWLGASAVLTLIEAGLWMGYDDHGGMPYPVAFTTAFSYALSITGALLQMFALVSLLLLVALPGPRTLRPTDRMMVAVPASACAALEVIRAARAADVPAAGALDWLSDDPGPRAAAAEILRSVTPPEDRR